MEETTAAWKAWCSLWPIQWSSACCGRSNVLFQSWFIYEQFYFSCSYVYLIRSFKMKQHSFGASLRLLGGDSEFWRVEGT